MKKHYFPKSDSKRLAWLFNFSQKIGIYAPSFNMTKDDVDAIKGYYQMLKYIFDLMESVRTFKKNVTSFKNHLMFAPYGSQLGTLPEFTLTAPPAVTPAGIFSLVLGKVAQIKTYGTYTESIGKDLGIVGAEADDDFSKFKPALIIKIIACKPKIKYKKNRTEGIKLFVDRNDGKGFVYLWRITGTVYTDKQELPAGQNSAVWKYKAIYVVNDIEVGFYSDEMSVVVGR